MFKHKCQKSSQGNWRTEVIPQDTTTTKNKQTAWAVRYEACGTKTTVIYILLLLDCALNTQLNLKKSEINKKYEIYEQE